ncbi:hypothetical protein [Planomonospora alba]
MSFQKKEMLLIDKIEPILQELDYENPVMEAARYNNRLPYTGAGIDPELGYWVFINFGRLPLNNDSPSYLYLIEFPDWHGERFIKVGIGLANRIRDHERHGGRLLQSIEAPRWQVRIAEKIILEEWPRFRPTVPLPQSGDTECLIWDVRSKIKLRSYIKSVATNVRLDGRH